METETRYQDCEWMLHPENETKSIKDFVFQSRTEAMLAVERLSESLSLNIINNLGGV